MINRMIKMDFHSIISKKSVWIAIILFYVISLLNYEFLKSEEPIANPYYIPSPAFHYFVFAQGGGSGFLFVFLPLFVAIATGDLFIRERNSSYLMFSLMRTDINTYIRSKIISIGICSAVIMALSQLLLLSYTLIVFPVNLPDPSSTVPYFAENIYLNSPLLYCLILILNSSAMAFFMGTLSILFSVILNNLYAAILAPYVLFIGFSEILMSAPLIYDSNLSYAFYSLAPLVMSGDYITIDYSWWVVLIYWIVLTIIIALLSILIFNKTYEKEKLI